MGVSTLLTDRSFVIEIEPEPTSLVVLRAELAMRLPPSHRIDDDVLLVAGLLVRQAQTWRGGLGGVRVRASTLGQVVNIEVIRDVEAEGDTGPACEDAFHSTLVVLARHTERFTVSTFPGTVMLSAQKVVHGLPKELTIDLRTAA